MSVVRDHPCLRCGACCAAFRGAFHWAESDAATPGGVPEALTEPVRPHVLAMRGTNANAPHCIALEGSVGERVSCRIYAQRPSPCRELGAAYEHGEPSPQCDRARARYGLAPLSPADWPLKR